MAARIVSIIGSRPEIVQAAPLSLAFASCVEEILVHTGQHYDPGMSDLQIADLRLPLPEYNLGVGSLPRTKASPSPQERIARVIETEQPDAVLVRGDTNATIAGARAAVAAGVPLLHVEAGLRSYRDDMPEEANRIETDRLSDLLFAPCEHARDVLLEEGVAGHGPRHRRRPRRRPARDPRPPARGRGGGRVRPRHRPPQLQHRLARAARRRARLPRRRRCRVIFPLHPRTRKSLETWSLEVPANVEVRDPVTYTEMLVLERDAVAIATDSGGVQREAYLWGVPCITMREETEWIETVSTGWNTLVGVDAEQFARRPRASRCRPSARRSSATATRAERIAELTVAHPRPRPWRGSACLSNCASASSAAAAWAASTSATTPSSTAPGWSRSPTPARSRARARASARRPLEYADWRELIEYGAGELDAVSIACPSEHHAEVALEALARRPARAGREADRDHACRTRCGCAAPRSRPDRKLMVGHVERFNPAVAKLRELVADGRLGTVYRAHATRVGPLPTRIQDTGVAIDLATHDLDVMQHVLGSSIHEIYADGGRFQHSSQEDLLTCLARFGGERATRSACSTSTG